MKIDFATIEDVFLFVNSDAPFMHQAFLNRKTSECFYVSEFGDFDFGEEQEIPDDIEDNPNYVEIPHKNDLNLGVKLVMSYAYTQLPDNADYISDMFRKKGAYRRYKTFLQSIDRLEDWHRYEEEQSQIALKEWCSLEGIDLLE